MTVDTALLPVKKIKKADMIIAISDGIIHSFFLSFKKRTYSIINLISTP